MEDIEIDDDHLLDDLSASSSLQSLGFFFVTELSDTGDITEKISQARKLFDFINRLC
jgi:hypothetical protein